MYKLTSLRKFFKPTSVAVLIIVVFTGLASGQTTAHAVGNVTFKVVVGTDTAYGIETLAFFPRTLKIHKGDTVTWEFRGFHNVHFAQTLLAFLSVDDVNGKKVAEFNPAILFPNAKSGDPFKAGANSGVQVVINPTNPSFSLVMDVVPGIYTYVCNVHPGMMGTIEVVSDQTPIPAPADIDKATQAEVNNAIAIGDKAILAALKKFTPELKGTTLQVSAGLQEGGTAVTRFFPEDATIKVGQSVTWTVPSGFNIHTVNFPLAKEGRVDFFSPIKDTNQMLHLLVSDAGEANVKSGATLPADGVAKSGVLTPRQSFTLTFTKPGVYAYYCSIHPNQFGTIVVVPSQPQ